MCVLIIVFFFKQKMADEMRISDWSSDVGSSDLDRAVSLPEPCGIGSPTDPHGNAAMSIKEAQAELLKLVRAELAQPVADDVRSLARAVAQRSEEHTSELQSLMRISYAVFCLKKKKHRHITPNNVRYATPRETTTHT